MVHSSNIMKLVIYDNQQLELLENWARKYFSAIKNYDCQYPQYKEHPFPKELFSDFWKIVPIKDYDSLEFVWILDYYVPYYKADPARYYTHLFGHKGEHSLLSVLSNEGLALDLVSSYNFEMRLYTSFSVTITLTKEGLKRYKDVIAYVFEYLQLMKREGPNKYIAEEIDQLGKLDFAHQEKSDPLNYVSVLASNLHYYPVEDILTIGSQFEEFNFEVLQKTIESFSLDNLRIVLTSKDLVNECYNVEKWYQTKYSKTDLPSDLQELYLEPFVEHKKTDKIFKLPSKNVFTPSDFEIFSKTASASHNEHPVKIYSSQVSEVWFKQDNVFKTPKGYITVILYSNE